MIDVHEEYGLKAEELHKYLVKCKASGSIIYAAKSLTEYVERFGPRHGQYRDEIYDLNKELASLKAELKQKDKKLSEFQNGIDIEEAKDGGDYYCLFGGTPYKAEQCRVSGKWFLIRSMPEAGIMPERLYPLPSTETQMEGE